MKIEEAIAIANKAKPRPKPRVAMDKLQGSVTAGQFTAGAASLAKRYDAMGETFSGLQKRLDQIAADVEYLQTFQPGQPPRRLQ
jgi:hypothetical protein